MAEPTRLWPALDIIARPDAHWPADADGWLGAFLDDFAPIGISDVPDRAPHRADAPSPPRQWRVFFADAGSRDAALLALGRDEWPARVDASRVEVVDEGWAQRSQSALKAVTVDQLIIAPPWDVPEAPPPGTTVIVIEPSMGFGTGHHQSTRLCLRALQRMDVRGRRVLDLGTGSGILAIASITVGAAHALGVDDDPDAITSALDNVRLNRLEGRVDARQADLSTLPAQAVDLVFANLNGRLLTRYAPVILEQLVPGGHAILSGFIEDERHAVRHAFREAIEVSAEIDEGWMGMTIRRPA